MNTGARLSYFGSGDDKTAETLVGCNQMINQLKNFLIRLLMLLVISGVGYPAVLVGIGML
jgi:hypothetical protein